MAIPVEFFDYWSFHPDGQVQFFQVCEGQVIQYYEFARREDAPVVLLDEDVRFFGEFHYGDGNKTWAS